MATFNIDHSFSLSFSSDSSEAVQQAIIMYFKNIRNIHDPIVSEKIMIEVNCDYTRLFCFDLINNQSKISYRFDGAYFPAVNRIGCHRNVFGDEVVSA
jgi:hypothetical protein